MVNYVCKNGKQLRWFLSVNKFTHKAVGVFVKPCIKTRVHRDFSTGELCPNASYEALGTAND